MLLPPLSSWQRIAGGRERREAFLGEEERETCNLEKNQIKLETVQTSTNLTMRKVEGNSKNLRRTIVLFIQSLRSLNSRDGETSLSYKTRKIRLVYI